MKWRLLSSWFAPEHTIAARGYDPAVEELGSWSRLKRVLAQRWLSSLSALPSDALAAVTGAGAPVGSVTEFEAGQNLSAVQELLALATPIAQAEAEPTAASQWLRRVPLDRLRSLSPTGSRGSGSGTGGGGGGSSLDAASSGVMVEEKGVSEDERSDRGSGDEEPRQPQDGREGGSRASMASLSERLRVPFHVPGEV